jgi:hypothetical protein
MEYRSAASTSDAGELVAEFTSSSADRNPQ